jgi:hypothetical protein
LRKRIAAGHSRLSGAEVKVELRITFTLHGKVLLCIYNFPIYLVSVNRDIFTFKEKVKPGYLNTTPLRHGGVWTNK